MSAAARPLHRLTALGTIALALAAAHEAGARKFQMSGTWELRRGGRGAFIPLQFATVMGPMLGRFVQTQTGTMGLGFPHPDPAPGMGGVSATGSDPASLLVPAHRFGGSFSAQIPLDFSIVQLTTAFDLDGPSAAATLAPGGGPGSFTWCPGDPACMAASAPLAQAGTRGQRVIYRAGPRRFGGSMRMLLSGRSSLTGTVGGPILMPMQVLHSAFFASQSPQQTGASYAATAMHHQPRFFATQPLIPPTVDGLILYPGPKVTTMLGVTDTGSGPIFYFPAATTTPMGFQAGRVTTSTGFPWTTGTVLIQQSGYSNTFWELMGSDLRTPLGAGNIALVSGGLVQRKTIGVAISRLNFGRVRITLAPPIPSLSPSGLAAAAALILLAVGYALRRRRPDA